jgi:hypothetical protein
MTNEVIHHRCLQSAPYADFVSKCRGDARQMERKPLITVEMVFRDPLRGPHFR